MKFAEAKLCAAQKSQNRINPKAGYVEPSRLPRGPNGRALCRRCGAEVPKGRRTFCGDDCIHEWRLRTQPAYARQHVFARDRGVCAACGLDTVALRRRIDTEASQDPERIGATRRARDRILPLLGFDGWEAWFWDADHIVPVIEGGGECGLENLRTLCRPCHQAATSELARRRAVQRRQERDGRVRLL